MNVKDPIYDIQKLANLVQKKDLFIRGQFQISFFISILLKIKLRKILYI